MQKSVHEDGDIEEEIREAFRVFDREGHGFITSHDLSQVLTTLGDKLSEGDTHDNPLQKFILPESQWHVRMRVLLMVEEDFSVIVGP